MTASLPNMTDRELLVLVLERVEHLTKAVYGNGRGGLLDRLEKAERSIEDNTADISEIRSVVEDIAGERARYEKIIDKVEQMFEVKERDAERTRSWWYDTTLEVVKMIAAIIASLLIAYLSKLI